jgi:hypothetical protein
MENTAELLRALNRAKVAFQARAIEAVIYGAPVYGSERCTACLGDAEGCGVCNETGKLQLRTGPP